MEDLQVTPAQQSVYYQQQTVQMLAQISQQIASISQIPVNATPPLPDTPFHPSPSDLPVNVFWLSGLVCSLSATLLSALIQQWVRDYLRTPQKSSSPLMKARIRQYYFEGYASLPAVAEFMLGLVHLSLILSYHLGNPHVLKLII